MKSLAIVLLLLVCTGCENHEVSAQTGRARPVEVTGFKWSECEAEILISDGECETSIGSVPVTIMIYEDFTTEAYFKLSLADRDALIAKLQTAEDKFAQNPYRKKHRKGGYRKIEPEPTYMQCFDSHDQPLSDCWVWVQDYLASEGRRYGPSREDGTVKITETLNDDTWLTVEWHPPGETGINSGSAQFKDWDQPLSFYFDTTRVDELLRKKGNPRR